MSPEARPEKPPAQFQLRGIFTSKAIFEVVVGDEFVVPKGRPAQVNVNIAVGCSIKMLVDGQGALVELEANIVPDQQWQPYRILVRIGGAFQSQDATPAEMDTFTRVAAPSILFPYVRETVNRITFDAPFGGVRLDPMNVSLLLNQTEWATTTSSSEPQQPSSQSASASLESEPRP